MLVNRNGNGWIVALALGMMLSAAAVARGAEEGKIDWDKARQLMKKQTQGQTLTAEESTYLERARKVRRIQQRQRGQGGPRVNPKNPPRNSTGMIPLTDMKATDTYKGQDGGLYGKGRNRPPKAHVEAAMKQLAAIEPLDAEGKASPDGKIVLISIGMSNTRQVFGSFRKSAAGEKNISPHLVIIDCARGGMDVESWINPKATLRRTKTTIWEDIDKKLAKAGVTAKQVQVAWMKHAKAGPARDGEFPAHAEKLSESQGTLVAQVRKHCPNLRVMYISSRTYAGYAASPTNPEPFAYESGFSVRWLIGRQIEGDKKLNYDPERGEVVAPLLLWGPYLWANGVKGRKTDDLIYNKEDYRPDGTHHSPSGQQKTGKLLLEFFKTDPLAKTWFLKADK